MALANRSNVLDLETFRDRRFLNPTDELAAKNWLEQRIQKAEREGPFSERAPLDHGMAVELLKQNHANRRIRTAKLQQYIEDMRSGRWKFNGESIIISKDGHLLDGQHRCFAALNVFEAPDVLFVFGVDQEARTTMDTGAKRFASDILSLEGIKNAALAASTARMLVALENGKGRTFVGRDRISTSVVVARVMEDEKLQDAAEITHRMKRVPVSGVTVGVVCASLYLLRKRNQGQAEEFIQNVFSTDAERGSAARVTRFKLVDMADMGGREKRLEVLVRGWNMQRSGEVQRLIPIMGELPRIL